jgi:hypothetical protein
MRKIDFYVYGKEIKNLEFLHCSGPTCQPLHVVGTGTPTVSTPLSPTAAALGPLVSGADRCNRDPMHQCPLLPFRCQLGPLVSIYLFCTWPMGQPLAPLADIHVHQSVSDSASNYQVGPACQP